jgi:hypothetical protein
VTTICESAIGQIVELIIERMIDEVEKTIS